MRINEITIRNFRGFESFTTSLDPEMNVVLANNTKGKTTLLQAIQIALGAYLQSMSQLPKNQPAAFRKNIKLSDVPVYYSEAKEDFVLRDNGATDIAVKATLITEGKKEGKRFRETSDIEWHRELKATTTVHSRANVGQLMDIVEEWERLRTKEDSETDIILPLVMAFGADRIDNNYKEKETSSQNSRLMKAYRYALAETVDFRSALTWYCNYNTNAKRSPEVAGTDRAFEEALETAARISNIAREEGSRGLWADVKVVGDEHTTRQKYEMMSSGFKAMVNMVAEIAYRCIMLNRWLGADAVKKTPGVVLIDEVDLYLHPHWQQHVLADLHEAFPNIQFIVSTHSPFIVQSVESRNVITLDTRNNSSESPKDRGIEEIVSVEMGMKEELKSVKYKKQLELAEKYFELVKEGKNNPEKIDEVRKKLENLEVSFSLINDPGFEAFLRFNRGDL